MSKSCKLLHSSALFSQELPQYLTYRQPFCTCPSVTRLELIMLYFYTLCYSTIPPKFYTMLLFFNIMLTIAYIMPTVLFADSFQYNKQQWFQLCSCPGLLWGVGGGGGHPPLSELLPPWTFQNVDIPQIETTQAYQTFAPPTCTFCMQPCCRCVFCKAK